MSSPHAFFNPMPHIFTIIPPTRASRMRISRANTVPPGAAIGPRTVRATKNVAMTVVEMVRAVATSPDGGKNLVVTGLFWISDLTAL